MQICMSWSTPYTVSSDCTLLFKNVIYYPSIMDSETQKEDRKNSDKLIYATSYNVFYK